MVAWKEVVVWGKVVGSQAGDGVAGLSQGHRVKGRQAQVCVLRGSWQYRRCWQIRRGESPAGVSDGEGLACIPAWSAQEAQRGGSQKPRALALFGVGSEGHI